LLAADVQKALDFKQVKREELTNVGLEFNRRSFIGGKYYYLVNHTAKDIDQPIKLNYNGKYAVILDPQTGSVGMAETSSAQNQLNVHVQLKSGEALILKVYDQEKPVVNNWTYLAKPGKSIVANNAWNLHFTAGGPELPSDQKLTKLISWTDFDDAKATAFFWQWRLHVHHKFAGKNSKRICVELGQSS